MASMGMATWLWLGLGTALIVSELATGTFYLLLLGLAAWAGAVAAYFGYGMDTQLGAAAVFALVSLALFTPYDIRRRQQARTATLADDDLDVGNEVQVEAVQDAQRVRVRYRGSSWDAIVRGDEPIPAPGGYMVIAAIEGNRLVVQNKR